MTTPRQIHLCEIVEATVSGDRATLYAVSDTGRRELAQVRQSGRFWLSPTPLGTRRYSNPVPCGFDVLFFSQTKRVSTSTPLMLMTLAEREAHRLEVSRVKSAAARKWHESRRLAHEARLEELRETARSLQGRRCQATMAKNARQAAATPDAGMGRELAAVAQGGAISPFVEGAVPESVR